MEDTVNAAGDIERTINIIQNRNDMKNRLKDIFKKEFDDEIYNSILEMIEQLKEEVNNHKKNKFIKKFNNILNDVIKKEKEIIPWQDAISMIQDNISNIFNDQSLREKAYILCNQARVIIGNAVNNSQNRIILDIENNINNVADLLNNLTSSLDIGKITDLLTEQLPNFNIEGCYLSIYENPRVYHYPDPVPESSRLILAFNENGRIKLKQDGIIFPSREIIPQKIMRTDKAKNYLVLALYFQNTQIGFIVFQSKFLIGNIYGMLASQISTGLKSIFLINEIIEKDKKLEKTLSKLNNNHIKLKETYKELKENQERLLISEKMASLGRLSASITHEISTPLASIRASLLELKGFINEYSISINRPEITAEDHKQISLDMNKSVNIANKEIEKLSGFIQGIKTQSFNINQNKKKIFFDIKNTINDVILFLNNEMHKKNISLDFNIIDKSIMLYGIQERMMQALTNLITNAIESMEQKKGGKILINVKDEIDNYVLIIGDQGCGIPKRNISKIFKPMFTTKPFGQSLGLGLTLVHDIIYSEFNGTINVRSRINQGTTFIIKIPKHSDK